MLSRRTFVAMQAAAAVKKDRAETVAQRQARLAEDHQRPKFHFLPTANWMNDPNGPIFWKGRYHMFYQHNPGAAVWGDMHWGHASSPDMIHWRHLPIALAPTHDGLDKDGVFSGCTVDDNGTPTIIYTGTKPEVQCLATGRDDLLRWQKRNEPILAAPPSGIDATGFRDPCVWREGDTWYMALGCGQKGVGGMVLLYKSADLNNWTYIQPLYQGKMDASITGRGPVASGEMYECPSFFPLGDKHVLFVSTMGGTPYWVGTYKDFEFHPESEGKLDFGAYYAPITQLDDRGRRILWGWIQERRSREAQRAAGWSGVLSLPRVLSLGSDNKLRIGFAPQTHALRRTRHSLVNMYVPNNRPLKVTDVAGDALEIFAEFEPSDAEEFGLRLLSSADGVEHTPVIYDKPKNRLGRNAELTLAPGENLQLHIFIDCSVVEVIANSRVCLTERAYTSNPECTQIALFSRGGVARLKSIQVYELKAISPNRMTT